jgi:hypothetical protein
MIKRLLNSIKKVFVSDKIIVYKRIVNQEFYTKDSRNGIETRTEKFLCYFIPIKNKHFWIREEHIKEYEELTDKILLNRSNALFLQRKI